MQEGCGVTESRVGSVVQALVGCQCGVDGSRWEGSCHCPEGGGCGEEGCQRRGKEGAAVDCCELINDMLLGACYCCDWMVSLHALWSPVGIDVWGRRWRANNG